MWSLSHLGQEDASRTSCDGGCGLLSMQKHSHLERQIIVCQQEGFPSVEDVPAQFTVSTILKICERIDGSVARFAQADEDVVDDGTPRIRNIEEYKFDDR